jgi:mono/diheme cytochrome c family protein
MRMTRLATATVLLGVWLAAVIQATPDGSSQRPPAPASPATAAAGTDQTPAPAPDDLNLVVRQYCAGCHNARTQSGNLSLEGFDVAAAHERAEVAEKVIVKLRADMMPPPGARRPSADTLRTLVETMETNVDRAAAADPTTGTRRFQRLTRAEYARVVKDLLGLDVDPKRWLPADTYLGNFDNMAAAQGLSVTLLEAYMRAASDVSRLAVGNPKARTKTVKHTNPIEVSQHAWEHLEGAPIGTRGGLVVTHDFPADGRYVFTIETLFGNGTGFEDVDLSIDGEGVALLGLEHAGNTSVPIRTEPILVRAGQRRVAAAFVRRIEGPYEDRLSPHGWSFVGGEDSQDWANYGITALPHLSTLMITGPHDPAGVSETPSRRRIFTCRPTGTADARACAESILTRLAREAYRRPVTADDLEGLMAFYDRSAAEQGFEIGVRTALQAMLSSPSFVFRLERQALLADTASSRRLSDLDLATRLSFFLWASNPDTEVLRVAEEGRLADPAVLDAQVTRMLQDPRAEALATRFASQWLRLQDVEDNQPEPYLYPDFTGQLAHDLVRETQRFFSHLVREDRSLLELYTADYTFLNERLGRHYGIPGVAGDTLRLVRYPDDTRRGVLGHGSVLLLTSMSSRTSPVLRGKWVMEVLMGAPPPPPPPNVPTFEETASAAAGRVLTTRERLEAHRANPTCNACHRLMDPIGLALDNFDVTGRVRIRENGVALDTAGTFYDGTRVATPRELTDLLMKRPLPLVRTFAANLLAYAIGRRVEHFDQPDIRAIVRDAAAHDYRLSSFILGVVKSAPFQMSQSQPAAPGAAPRGK